MKFVQFVELEEKLAENDQTIENLQGTLKDNSNPDELILEFFGINKALASWGVKKIYNKKLANHKNKFKDDTMETIKDSIKKLVNMRGKLKNQIELLNNAGKPVPDQTSKQLGDIERQIIKIVNRHIDEQGKLKTQQVGERIDSSKKMKDSAKMGLKYLWNKLLTEARIELLTFLMEQKVIESANVTQELMDYIKKKDSEEKEKAKKTNDVILKMKKCEEAGGTWDDENNKCIKGEGEGEEAQAGEKSGKEL